MKSLKIIFLLFLILVQSSASRGNTHAPNNAVVVMETGLGEIILEIYTGRAPVTAVNFLE